MLLFNTSPKSNSRATYRFTEGGLEPNFAHCVAHALEGGVKQKIDFKFNLFIGDREEAREKKSRMSCILFFHFKLNFSL